MTRFALDVAMRARMELAAQLRTEPHDDDLPATLAEVRDSGLFTVAEMAELLGLSRSRVYQLLELADGPADNT